MQLAMPIAQPCASAQARSVAPCHRPMRSGASRISGRVAPRRARHLAVEAAEDDVLPVPPAVLPPLSEQELQAEAAFLGGALRLWLDEEWTPQEVHRDLGEAAAGVYMQLRQGQEETEVGDIVLGVSTGLLAFNFRECFVGPFDVGNKVAEMLMLRSGAEVCCTSPAEREAVQRYERALEQEKEDAA